MEQKYKMINAVVAFIDVLGSSEAIEEDEVASLNAIHIAYDKALAEFKRRSTKTLIEPKVNIFSDNIALSVEIVENEEEKAFLSIISFSAMLQMYMWTNGFLVRGGISYGTFFVDEIMIWGKTLLRTHKFEESVSIYPRIIIEPKIAEVLRPVFKSKRINIINKDFDGMFFIDPFGLETKTKEVYLNLLEYFINDNLVRLEKYQNNIKIYQKICWLQQYFEEKYDKLINDKEQ
ncbi:MAG: hypothetical protein J1E61_05615 [Lachnospiraceae bacterium]|nr:hypothetical protein [Lachnospiraceae bacterium]